MSDLSEAGIYPNANGVSIFPGTQFTGPVTAGNVVQSDGTGNLAALGGSSGTGNVGYCVMAQSAVVTQVTAGTSTIVIPAQSQILSITIMVTTIWSGSSADASVGATAGTTDATAFSANTVALGAVGQVVVTPTTAAQIANWDNVSNATFQSSGPKDVNVVVNSVNSGTGVGTLTVTYLQGINLAS